MVRSPLRLDRNPLKRSFRTSRGHIGMSATMRPLVDRNRLVNTRARGENVKVSHGECSDRHPNHRERGQPRSIPSRGGTFTGHRKLLERFRSWLVATTKVAVSGPSGRSLTFGRGHFGGRWCPLHDGLPVRQIGRPGIGVRRRFR